MELFVKVMCVIEINVYILNIVKWGLFEFFGKGNVVFGRNFDSLSRKSWINGMFRGKKIYKFI